MDKTTTLTISVVSSIGVPHYLVVKHGVLESVANSYIPLLQMLNCRISLDSSPKIFSLTIHEPNLIAAELIIYNNRYLKSLGMSELDLAAPAIEPGDPLFWELFDVTNTILVKYMFSNFSNEELQVKYECSEATLTRRINAQLEVIKIKYPSEKINNRKQLKIFGISIGVRTTILCTTCGQKL
jgi:hypothetical protein